VEPTENFPTDKIGKQLLQVARLMKAHDKLPNERAVFFTELGGFDSHKDTHATMDSRMPMINGALEAFKKATLSPYSHPDPWP